MAGTSQAILFLKTVLLCSHPCFESSPGIRSGNSAPYPQHRNLAELAESPKIPVECPLPAL